MMSARREAEGGRKEVGQGGVEGFEEVLSLMEEGPQERRRMERAH